MQGHKKICVLGSANADYFLYVHKIPAKGQTIQSQKYLTANGGKGANQAVAAGKLSAGKTTFIGQAGQDDAMKRMREEMEKAGVDLKWKLLENVPTGMAYIFVDNQGENSIVIHGGANMEFASLTELDPQFVKAISQADYLLLQKEIPMEINRLAAKLAKSLGKEVLLDCGGQDVEITQQLLSNLTYISPNETELLRLDPSLELEEGSFSLEEAVKEIRAKLLKRHPHLKVLLKLGSRGSAVVSIEEFVKGDVSTSVNPAILNDYKIIDTVGAGDCFTGAYAVRHSELDWSNPANFAQNYRSAMQFGNSAAFLCITKNGAMPSMPDRKSVDEFMQKYQIK